MTSSAQKLLDNATPGKWVWDGDDGMRTASDHWITCFHHCRWPAYEAGRSRGEMGVPNKHEHLETEWIIDGIWHNDDTAGVGVGAADAALLTYLQTNAQALITGFERHQDYRRMWEESYEINRAVIVQRNDAYAGIYRVLALHKSADRFGVAVCVECSADISVKYPCPTVQAVGQPGKGEKA